MSRYYLTNAAEDDLRNIIEYTLEKWGIEQVLKYRDRLETRLMTLAEFPGIGRANVNLPDDILYVVEGKHYIFLKSVDDGIEVIRFIHARMDAVKHLSEHL